MVLRRHMLAQVNIDAHTCLKKYEAGPQSLIQGEDKEI